MGGQNGFESSQHGLSEKSTLDEVLAQLKYQVVPALVRIEKTAEKQEKHLDRLNGSVESCLRHDAVLAEKVGNLEENTDDTAKKQTKSEDKNTRTIITLGSLIIITLIAALVDILSRVKII